MTMTDFEFETQYKNFLVIKTELTQITQQLAIYQDTSLAGYLVRPIALTGDPAILERAKYLVGEWDKFATLAESRAKAGKRQICAAKLYSYRPAVIEDFSDFNIHSFNAITVSKKTKEEILYKIDTRLNRAINPLKKKENREIEIANLREDKRRFSSFPDGTVFRLRNSGYRDVTIDLYPLPVNGKTGEPTRIRVTSPGVILDSRKMLDVNSWHINNDDDAVPYLTVYHDIKSIPCSFMPSYDIYLLSEVEQAKKDRALASEMMDYQQVKMSQTRRMEFIEDQSNASSSLSASTRPSSMS